VKKAELLRAALIAGNTWCKANPEQITVWVEKGHIQIEATGEASFMYHYTIQVLAMDFPGQIDDLMLPLLAWVWQQQPDLLLNPDNNRKVEFDADIVNDDVADILFKVPVWERVMVTNATARRRRSIWPSRARALTAASGRWSLIRSPGIAGMSNNDALFSQLDEVFAAILSGMSPAGRQRTARSVGTMLRRSQSQRIGRQEAPDGAKYPQRRRGTARAGRDRFIWQGKPAAA
jgi:hypothetical protein